MGPRPREALEHPNRSLHEDIASLSFLLGTWEGGGSGRYPTIEPFLYGERVVFDHVGDAFLTYGLESWLIDDGSPLHLERGFLRPGAEPGEVELTLAHPLGLTEVSHGTLEGPSLTLSSVTIGRTHTGSEVTGVVRRYRVADDVMRYELDMAMDAIPMARHLDGELRRITR